MSMTNKSTVGLEPFLGEWINTNPSTSWIREFMIEDSNGSPTIQVIGARPHPVWGRAQLDQFRLKPGEHAFRALFQLPGLSCDLIAYSNLGLVVIAAYLDFDDPSIGGHLSREFFVSNSDNGSRTTT